MSESTDKQPGDRLGKLAERYAPPATNPALLAVAIGLGAVGVIGVGVALLVGSGARLWVLIPACVLLALAIALGLKLKFGGRDPEEFEIRRNGVRYRAGGKKVELLWEEIQRIELHRDSARGRGKQSSELIIQGPKKYIVLSAAFLAALDDPAELLQLVRESSGKDFKSALGDSM